MTTSPSPYGDFLQIVWRTDSNGKRKSIQITNEVHKIVGNKIILSEIPDEFQKVRIANMFEKKFGSLITNPQCYTVNYNTGEVFFHESLEGTTITVEEYYGRGYIQLFGRRVVLQNENGLYTSNTIEDFANEVMQRINNLVLNSGSGNTEVVDARANPITGVIHTTLKERLDTDYQSFDNFKNEIMSNIQLGGRFRIKYNSALDALEFEVI